MYYPDGTRYDQVDGTGPVVPFTGTPKSVPSTWYFWSGRDWARIPGNILAGTRNTR